MLLERVYDDRTQSEYDIWSEMNINGKQIRVYDLDYRIILDEALESICYNSVWSFSVCSVFGCSEKDVLCALEEGGSVFIRDDRTEKIHELTREKLIGSISEFTRNFYDKMVTGYKLKTAEYGCELCDEIVQVALFGRVVYES